MRADELKESQLTHHRHLIPLLPAFDDAAIFDPVENQPIDVHPPPGRWYFTEGPRVRSLRDPARADFVAAHDLVFDREVEIRKGGQQSADHLLEPFHRQVGIGTARNVDHAVRSERLVRDGDVAAVESLHPPALEIRDWQCLLRRHGSSPVRRQARLRRERPRETDARAGA